MAPGSDPVVGARDGRQFCAWAAVTIRVPRRARRANTVCGIPDSRTEIVMLKPPDDGTRLELSRFVRPDSVPGSPAAMANELGLRNVAFEVNDLQAAMDWAANEGYGLVGGIGEYEGVWRMAYVRGPEGIIVSLAEPIG